MAQQHGNSGRGPRALDEARRNLPESVETDDELEGQSLASGEGGDASFADNHDNDDAIEASGESMTDAEEDGSVVDKETGKVIDREADRRDRLYADTLVDEKEMRYGDEHGAPLRRR